MLKPAIDAVLQRGEDVRIVIEFGDWSGMSGGALWEDLKMGIERFTKWKKIALVTDVDWMRQAISVFGWMTPGDVKTFTLAERDAAIKWAATPEPCGAGVVGDHGSRVANRGITSPSPPEERTMDIVRNPDGTLIVPVEPARVHDDDADTDAVDAATAAATTGAPPW